MRVSKLSCKPFCNISFSFMIYFSILWNKKVTLIDHSTKPPHLVSLTPTKAMKSTLTSIHATNDAHIDDNKANKVKCVLQENSRKSYLTMNSSNPINYNDNKIVSKGYLKYGTYRRILICFFNCIVCKQKSIMGLSKRI